MATMNDIPIIYDDIVTCPKCGHDCNFKVTIGIYDIWQCPKCKEIVVR